MEKLKKIFSEALNVIKTTYQKFPITLILVYIFTFINVFMPEEFIDNFYDNDWHVVLALTMLGTLFSEIWYKENIIKYVGTAVSFIIATIFKILYESGISTDGELLLSKILVTYIATLSLLTFYRIMKNENVTLQEFGIKVLSNFGRTTLTYVLANIGIGIVITTFIALILDGEDIDGIERIFILLAGAYYVPAMIITITDMSIEQGKFIRKLITNIFTPVIAFLLVIFYMYVVKLMIEGTLFEANLFLALSCGFALGLPVVLLRKNYDNDEKTKKLTLFLVYAFVPFIVLQLIGMNIRVNQYGLTMARYMAFVLLFFESIFIFLSIYKEGKYLKEMLLVTVALVFICVLSPFNFIDVPNRNQIKRLEKIYSSNDFNSLSNEEKKNCKSIYVYLNRNDGEKLLEERFTKEELKQICDYVDDSYYDNDDEYDYNRTDYVSVSKKLDGFDISEYTRIDKISDYYRFEERKDLSAMEIRDNDNAYNTYVDFKSVIDKLIDEDYMNNSDEYFESNDNNVLKTKSENVDIYLTSISFDYDIYTEEISYFNYDGYVLVK